MNIGIITRGYPPEKVGGAEFQAKELAFQLSSMNHKVTIFAGSQSDNIIDENRNLRVQKIRYKDIKIFRIFISQIIAFLPKIKRERSNLDVLICYQVNPPGIIGLLSKAFYKIPLITSIRAENEYISFVRKFVFTSLILRFSNKIIVQAPKIKKDLIQNFKKFPFIKNKLKEIKVIPNGIKIHPTHLANHNHKSGILFVGRLQKVKGIEYLINALKGINEKLIVIGEGPERNQLKQLSEGMNIEFLGEQPKKEIMKYMLSMKILVLPSLSEAFPNVVLEAMSAGMPVIATNVGGIPDMITHGETGYLTGPGDSEQIQKYISILLNDEGLRNKMGKNCLKEVKKYSWDNISKEYEQVISGCLSETKAS